MKTNTPNYGPRTVYGTPAIQASPIDQLRRSVMACMLWEDGFYESGTTIGERIRSLVAQCDPMDVARLAIQARSDMHLRHAPLLLVRELARHPAKPALVADTLRDVIQRADELAEFVSLYWQDGKQPLSAQVKRGLAQAFGKFNGYQLAKYNRDGKIKLRDVLFMSHAKPKDEAQAALWKQLADGTLPAPDTWEVALSAGADKKATFERLIAENKLGYLALLRNLRNMQEVGVDCAMVTQALLSGAAASRVLPFRFVAAARSAPQFEGVLDQAMQASMSTMPKLSGKTVVLIDVSGSMDSRLSAKSDLTRIDAACALASLVRGLSDDVRVFSFSSSLVEVPSRAGMALIDAIRHSQPHSSTYLGAAVRDTGGHVPDADRMIVFTDEESSDVVGAPTGKGYMINVASGKNGVGFGDWTRITGFSEAVVGYIQALEQGEETCCK